MTKKLQKITIYAGLLAIIAAITALLILRRDPQMIEISEEERLSAYLLLLEDLPSQSEDYMEYLRLYGEEAKPFPEGSEKDLTISSQLHSIHEIGDNPVEMSFTVKESGFYTPFFTYRRTDEGLGNLNIQLMIDGERPFAEARSLELARIWKDETKDFGRDRYNDETLPLQIPSSQWTESPTYDGAGRLVDPIAIFLTKGEHQISLKGTGAAGAELKALQFRPNVERPEYAEYRAELGSHMGNLSEPVTLEINAIDYLEKNSYNVRLGSMNDPSLTPYHRVDRLLNVIDGSSWDRAGEEIVYEIDVPVAGAYNLTLHYNNPNSDFSVFRSVRINGEIPFQELKSYRFRPTGTSRWANETLSDHSGTPYDFYLDEGVHYLSLKAEKEPVTEATRALKMIISHMNYFGIEIMKVAGRDIDEFRTWRLTEYLPKTASYLDAYHTLISHIISDLARYSNKGISSSMTASLQTALFKLEKLSENPDELPVYLKDIYSTSIYDRPITQTLGDTVNMLEDTDLSLDMLFMDTETVKRKANASLFQKAFGGLSSLMSTFTSEKYVTRNDEEVLNIWVTRPITHTDIMQKMADADFTKETGIEVKVSVMPDPNRLLLATAADRTPDVAMGLPSHIPFDLAIRGAALELSEFDDYWQFASEFSPGAFIPYVVNEKVFGMPETLDFHTLVYRTDIFNQLDLTPPDTWDDVIELLPVLQRYGMNFYHPIAGGLPTLKWFYQTSPFVYQFGGKLYEKDGLSVSLDNPRTVEGLRFLSELFNLYALQEQVPVFYNSFRFGVIPAGIVDSQSYLQMKYAAPELKGQWALAPYPGIPDEQGDPQRWFIANGVAALVMKETNKPDESWQFLKWWLSKETQVDFGYRLQATYGPEYLWISANLNALKESPIDEEEKDVILEQVRWQRDVPRTPAQYMLERGLSDIWINSATQNKSVRTEIDKMIPVIDREVTRKMTEFGFIDTERNVLKPFIVPDIQWVEEQMAPYKEEASHE